MIASYGHLDLTTASGDNRGWPAVTGHGHLFVDPHPDVPTVAAERVYAVRGGAFLRMVQAERPPRA